MSAEIYLGEPPPNVKEWIRKHHKQDQFNFLYKKEGDTGWQEWEPQSDDIQIASNKVTIKATSFKAMDGFVDVREVKLPNKWNNGAEDVDVTSIGPNAFETCNRLINVIIPNSVTNIGQYAFRGCSGLTSVEFKGRTLAQVKAIPDASGNLKYSWGLDESVIHAELETEI